MNRMLRLILFLLAGYMIFTFVKNFLKKGLSGQAQRPEGHSTRNPIDRIQDAEFTEIDSKIKNKPN
ncbi:MAG: hypothetical protein HGB11_00995 [Chlorobiales bacterium]|nr:hypothetical protein [Chlorobiales bacterium]